MNSRKKNIKSPKTLAIDIGGSGLKAIVLSSTGKPLSERVRVATPKPATPKALISALGKLVADLPDFDRVSVGFPGVVTEGVVHTAVNLAHASWVGFDLQKRLAKLFGTPVRVLNDAGVQGHGVIEGRGVEMLLAFGTGMGCALFVDGRYVPNLELAHHPFKNGETYEDYVGQAALDRIGAAKWNKRVAEVVALVLPIFNPRKLYLGGGNSRLIRFRLPPRVHKTKNIAGLLGGIALWRNT